MQEEVENRTVAITTSAAKFTGRLFKAAICKYLEHRKNVKVQKANKEMSRLLKCKVGDPMFDLFKLTFDKNGRAQIISVSILKGEDTYYVLSNEEGDEIKHSGMRWKF